MITPKFEIDYCQDDDLDRYMIPEVKQWYPMAMCFKNRDNTTINKNWFMQEYSIPVVGISYCRNNTWVNSNWCKSHEEIEEWLQTNPAYFVHMKTVVQEKMFADDENVQKFPYYGDKENYFPTSTQMGSIDFGKITVDPTKRDKEF